MLTPRFWTGLLVAGGLATLLTLLIAWPVVLHPTEQIYGHELLGRDAEPYSIIQQFAMPGGADRLPQPLTDAVGSRLARAFDPVAAYNFLVLLSFPLAAMSAYALARYLTGSHGAGLVAGLAFAFSPAHLAHAAYHPHFAQTEWLPLYLLGLVVMVDRVSIPRVVAFAAAGAALVTASVYGALFGVVLAPIVLAAFWAIRSDADRNIWPLLGPALVVIVLAGAAAAWFYAFGPPISRELIASGSLDDIAFFRGRWWAYFVPALDHPWLGTLAARLFDAGGVDLQVVEEQLYLSLALVVLAVIATGIAIGRWKAEPRWRFVPATVAVAIAAALISLGPGSATCESAAIVPACLIYRVAPMFTVYARFGMVTQLMIAIAAAGGVAALGRSAAGRRVALALLLVAAFEYWPLPARAHDVMPTTAHRWLAAQPAGGTTLDCYPGVPSQTTVPWLMGRDVRFLGEALASCADPQLGMKLAGLRVQRVLVRKSRIASALPTPLPPGITADRSFADADLYAVAATPPAIVTVSTDGFFGFENSGDDWWQWMSPRGTWTVRNTTTSDRRVSLSVNLQPVGAPRRLTIAFDSQAPVSLALAMTSQDLTLGPWTLTPGDHTITFTADGDPVRPADTDGGNDRRPLTVSFKNERWKE